MTPTVEPAGVSEERIWQLIRVIDAPSIRQMMLTNDATDLLTVLHLALDHHQQLAELQRELTAARWAVEHQTVSGNVLEKQLAEMRGALRDLVRVCEDTVVEDYPEYEIAQVALAPTSQPSRGKCELMKCADCGAEWPRTDKDQDGDVCKECFDNFDGMTEDELFGRDCAQPSLSAQIESASKALKETPERYKQPSKSVAKRIAAQNDEPNPFLQPERQGADRYSGLDGLAQIAVEVMARNDSKPPTDDIVAGLRRKCDELRHLMQIQVCSPRVQQDIELYERAIAALGEKGAK